MAIKQIFMITTGNPFFVDQSGVAEASQKAERELSEALNEGYTLFAHYPMQAAQVSGQIFILHKPDDALAPITKNDLELIAEAWGEVDALCPLITAAITEKQGMALIALANAVEKLLFPTSADAS